MCPRERAQGWVQGDARFEETVLCLIVLSRLITRYIVIRFWVWLTALGSAVGQGTVLSLIFIWYLDFWALAPRICGSEGEIQQVSTSRFSTLLYTPSKVHDSSYTPWGVLRTQTSTCDTRLQVLVRRKLAYKPRPSQRRATQAILQAQQHR
jgi:hypothetical protein